MPPLDGLSLYALLVRHKPARYIEIGSGNSTKFARKAITDHNLPTKIISVDPSPRAEIDALCDRVVRAPLQSAVDRILGTIQPGDLLFYDGSHHVFTSSDAAVFFTEILPMIPAAAAMASTTFSCPTIIPSAGSGGFTMSNIFGRPISREIPPVTGLSFPSVSSASSPICAISSHRYSLCPHLRG